MCHLAGYKHTLYSQYLEIWPAITLARTWFVNRSNKWITSTTYHSLINKNGKEKKTCVSVLFLTYLSLHLSLSLLSAVDLIRLGGGRLRFLVAKSEPEVSEKISASSCWERKDEVRALASEERVQRKNRNVVCSVRIKRNKHMDTIPQRLLWWTSHCPQERAFAQRHGFHTTAITAPSSLLLLLFAWSVADDHGNVHRNVTTCNKRHNISCLQTFLSYQFGRIQK